MPPKIPRGNKQIHKEAGKITALSKKIDKIIEKLTTKAATKPVFKKKTRGS